MKDIETVLSAGVSWSKKLSKSDPVSNGKKPWWSQEHSPLNLIKRRCNFKILKQKPENAPKIQTRTKPGFIITLRGSIQLP